MKKRNLLLTYIFLLPLTLFAQERSLIRFGVKAGGTLSQMSIDVENGHHDDPSFKLGYFGGGLMEISTYPGSKFKLQLEVLYNRYNFKNVYSDVYTDVYAEPIAYKSLAEVRLHQISVPILAKYFVIPSLSINMGMSANFNLAAKATAGFIEYTNYSPPPQLLYPYEFNVKDVGGYHLFQAGVLAGVTYYLYEGLFIDGRYNYLLGKLVKNPRTDGADYKNINAFQLGIGYKF